ncbi:MAG: hypothetical protein LBK71_00865 [Verrucomicrobiales bacterium]|jgi:hypothetical protein|nr:hypothetical protein [Verrucomicrobiales bacterium]
MKPNLRACGLLAVFIVSAGRLAANPADPDANHQPPTQTAPDHGRAFREHAPEHLEIKVLKVQIAARSGLFHQGQSLIKIQATVTQVYRSGAGLQPGQTILIHYARKNSIGCGDIQPTVPAEGAVTAAFLRQQPDETIFAPAARQYSFAPPAAPHIELLHSRQKAAGNGATAADSAAQPPADEIQLRAEDAATEDPLPTR